MIYQNTNMTYGLHHIEKTFVYSDTLLTILSLIQTVIPHEIKICCVCKYSVENIIIFWHVDENCTIAIMHFCTTKYNSYKHINPWIQWIHCKAKANSLNSMDWYLLCECANQYYHLHHWNTIVGWMITFVMKCTTFYKQNFIKIKSYK